MLKILIADDEKLNHEYFKRIFKDTNSVLLHADNGKEAIEIIKTYPDVDIVFMDIKMSLISGYDATGEIRTFNKDVIIVAQTAFAYTYDDEITRKQGCNDFVSKPFNAQKIIQIVKKHLPEKVEDLES